MTDENENRPTRAPLTLKPRSGGSVSTGTVKQSFSHGRTKTVVVETKRPRMGSPTNLAAPSLAEKRPAFDVRGPQAPARSTQGPPADPHALSEDERLRRQKVAAEFAARQQAERAAADARAREAAAARAARTRPPRPPPRRRSSRQPPKSAPRRRRPLRRSPRRLPRRRLSRNRRPTPRPRARKPPVWSRNTRPRGMSRRARRLVSRRVPHSP